MARGGPLRLFLDMQAIRSACLSAGYDERSCREVSFTVFYSKEGKFGKRPGAVCSFLGACRSDCTLEGSSGEVDIDLCATGTEIQALLNQSSPSASTTSSPPESEDSSLCVTNAECTSIQYCSFATTAAKCTCNAATGFDECSPRGQCSDWCNQYDEQLSEFNSRFTDCSTADDCDSTETCNTALASSCQKMKCDPNTGITIESCDGICVPENRNMAAAVFSSSGSRIDVTLNFAAIPSGFPCTEIFNSDTVDKLGDAFCTVDGKILTIYLRGGAAIVSGDDLSLLDDQNSLKDILPTPTPFTGSVTVSPCQNCVKPIAGCVYPPVLSAGCSGQDVPDAVFDATYSIDTAGRSLIFAWTLDSSSCYAAANDDAFTSSSECATLKAQLEAE